MFLVRLSKRAGNERGSEQDRASSRTVSAKIQGKKTRAKERGFDEAIGRGN